MRAYLALWKERLRYPWTRVLLYTALMLVMPEYLSLVLAIPAGVAAYKDARSRQATLGGGSFFVPLVMYVLYMLIGVVYSIDPLSTLSSVGMWGLALLFYIALSTVLIDGKRLSAALAYLSVGLGLNGLIAVIQYICKANFKWNIDLQCWKWLDRILNALVGYPLFADHGKRAAASFTNPNIFAEFLIILLPFLFFYLTSKTGYKRTVVTRIGTVLAVFGLLFSFCRGAYLALILIAALFLAGNIRKAPFLLLITCSVLILIPNAVYARLFSLSGSGEYISGVVDGIEGEQGGDLLGDIIENAGDITGADGEKPPQSAYERVQVWAASIDAIAKRPVFGYGSGGVAIKNLLATYGIAPPHSHNLVLQLLLEGGVFGLGIWLAIAFSAIRKGYRLLRRSARPQSGMAVVAFVCGFCMISMTDYTLLTPKLVCGVLVALGLIEVFYNLYMQDKKIRPLSSFVPLCARK